ncbi:hypothetical protein Tco_1334254 [Tanacetum coccineum]
MLWGIITRSNVDYAELLWEEFVQAIKTFFTDKANLSLPTKNPKPHAIPYCRFTKVIIYYLGSRHNIHRRPMSPVHVTGDDFLLGNLKFVPKGENGEVFGKPIPQELIMIAIQNLESYKKYLEMAARKPTAKEGGKKKTASKADKPTKPAPAKQPTLAKQIKHVKEKTFKSTPSKKILKGKVMKVYKGKRSDHLVDEEDKEDQPASEPQVEDDEYNLQRGITRQLLVVEGKGKGIATNEVSSTSTGLSAQPQDDTSANVVCDTMSPADAETGADTEKSNNKGDNEILNVVEEQGQAGSDPCKTPESRPPPERVHMEEDQAGSNSGQSHVVLAGPSPKSMHGDFVATVYPQVHESLKLTPEEKVHMENPPSSSGTLSSMKNIDDAFTFGDQFLNDKPIEEEPGKANMETKVESMLIVPIYQASSSVPPISTPIIDLTPSKPVSPPAQEPVFIATTTTTTLPLPPPPPQQSTIVPELAIHVSALEKICANFEKKHKLQDKTTQALSSRVFTLENHDLYSKIDNYVNETMKEAVHNALQALIRERFRDLTEFEMKEILRDQMFESGFYRSHPEHTTLYEALEAPISSSTSSKGLWLKQEEKHDSDASALKQPPTHTSSAWKTSDTIESPSSSSKKKTTSQSEHHVDDIPILDDVHFSDSEDTGAAHLPKIKTRPDWLKPVPEVEALETLEPNWVVPPNDLPKTKNNWANAIAKAYKYPKENKLLQKTRDVGFFTKWYCKQIEKSKLVKADLKGPAYKLIDLVNLEGHRVVHDVSKPLPLGGPPGQVTIQTQYFFNKDLEYLVSGDKERRNALSISKLKAAYYPDFGLEEFIPSLWIKSERDYDISAAYGISHWWFKRKEFYITRYSAPSDHRAVRSHMRILSVVSLKTFSRYGYTYMRENVLCRADYKEYKISEDDFINLHLNDFEDMYLLHL